MSDVMTCSTVDENFSFLKSKHEPTRKESCILTGSDIEDESTVSFNDRLDIASSKSSENTICGSDDSVASHLNSRKNSSKVIDEAQDSANSTIRSDTSYEDYAYMTTENTMIDTTYNNSESCVNDTNMLKNSQCISSLNTENDIDSKRVVVQILSSDTKDSTKSIGVFENKSVSENQNTLSFRDDVCKLLTSSRPSLDYGSDTLEEKDVKETLNASNNSIKAISSFKSSTIHKHLRAAAASSLRAIHFMLYDKYGLCGTELQIARTRRRILRFSGYPFDNKSFKYQKKFKSLLKMPLEMMVGMHEAIFGKTPALVREHMANNLIAVFSDPGKYDEIISLLRQNVKLIPESEYIDLKERAVSGPTPFVKLEKLSSDDLAHALQVKDSDKRVRQKKENFVCKSVKPKEAIDDSSYDLPAYILKGPGKKLKKFRSIVENVRKANEKELNLLHRLLYGRDEPIDVCRRNILEFSGFLDCQNEFIFNVHETLRRLEGSEILKLCKILCLRAITNSGKRKIMKIMEYLKRPFNPVKIKVTGFRQKIFPKDLDVKHSFSESRVPMHPVEMWDEPENAECPEGSYRLRDFRKICSNIECSAPPDLTELNDLLFMKPSDDTEIHDRILNFTRFGFSESSIHYHYRKTLMFYMGPCIVRKIAKLLDIDNWNVVYNHEDLSGSILNFLIEKKVPDFFCAKPLTSSMSFSMSSLHNSSDQVEFPAEITQQSNQASTSYQQEAASLSKYTVLADLGNTSDDTDFQKKKDNFMPNDSNTKDDSISLRDFIHHPTDDELKECIDAIVEEGLFSITLGDVVTQVYLKYPHFNLKYREQFIKSETRKIVLKIRQSAVEKIKQNCVT